MTSPSDVSLDQLGPFLTALPREYVVAAISLPIVLAAMSRRAVAFLGALLLATVSLLVLFVPTVATTAVAIGAYAGSLMLAFGGMLARRRDAAVNAKLVSLRNDVNQLLAAETRRFLTDMKSGGDDSKSGQ